MPLTLKLKSMSDIIKFALIITLIVSVIGYIDYITEEISIDVFYIFIICGVSWFTGIFLGLLCVAEILLSRIIADYYCGVKILSFTYGWNAFNFIFTCLLVCILSATLKKAISKHSI